MIVTLGEWGLKSVASYPPPSLSATVRVDEHTKCAVMSERVDTLAPSKDPSAMGLPGWISEGVDVGEMHASSAVMIRVQRERRTRSV